MPRMKTWEAVTKLLSTNNLTKMVTLRFQVPIRGSLRTITYTMTTQEARGLALSLYQTCDRLEGVEKETKD